MDNEHKTSENAPPAIADAIDKILAHPELISMVASALGSPNGQAPPAADSSQNTVETASLNPEDNTASSEAAPASASPLSGQGIDQKIPDLMTSLAPLLSGLSDSSKKSLGKKTQEDHRACLLKALKPYVSPGRREAIDYMIRISQISDIFKQLY